MEKEEEEEAAAAKLRSFLQWAAEQGITDSPSSSSQSGSCLGHSLFVSHFPEAGGCVYQYICICIFACRHIEMRVSYGAGEDWRRRVIFAKES